MSITPQTLGGPAGDVQGNVDSMDAALSRLLKLTTDSLRLWEADGERRFDDEFALTPAEVAKLAVEWRDAHIAKLIADVARLWRDLDQVHRTDYELPIGTVAAEPEVTA